MSCHVKFDCIPVDFNHQSSSSEPKELHLRPSTAITRVCQRVVQFESYLSNGESPRKVSCADGNACGVACTVDSDDLILRKSRGNRSGFVSDQSLSRRLAWHHHSLPWFYPHSSWGAVPVQGWVRFKGEWMFACKPSRFRIGLLRHQAYPAH